MKFFIITVDTEGDNLWSYKDGDVVSTLNTRYLPRFQSLCEKYGFKPVYLTNFEMANDANFVNMAKKWAAESKCEIGIHLHAWNNPPFYNLDGPYNGNSYLIEYPYEIMRDKFLTIYSLLVNNFGIHPISHRAGRWAMDDRYFHLLEEFSIKVDCSFTPGINWTKAKGQTRGGCDYSREHNGISFINSIMEVPPTIYKFHNAFGGSYKHKLKSLVLGNKVWLRPAISSLSAMKKVLDKVMIDSNVNYAEFMIHSSEIMPGGSPYFKDELAIEREYRIIEDLFSYASNLGLQGITLEEFYYQNIK